MEKNSLRPRFVNTPKCIAKTKLERFLLYHPCVLLVSYLFHHGTLRSPLLQINRLLFRTDSVFGLLLPLSDTLICTVFVNGSKLIATVVESVIDS